jgi:hypothetical protein
MRAEHHATHKTLLTVNKITDLSDRIMAECA